MEFIAASLALCYQVISFYFFSQHRLLSTKRRLREQILPTGTKRDVWRRDRRIYMLKWKREQLKQLSLSYARDTTSIDTLKGCC